MGEGCGIYSVAMFQRKDVPEGRLRLSKNLAALSQTSSARFFDSLCGSPVDCRWPPAGRRLFSAAGGDTMVKSLPAAAGGSLLLRFRP